MFTPDCATIDCMYVLTFVQEENTGGLVVKAGEEEAAEHHILEDAGWECETGSIDSEEALILA